MILSQNNIQLLTEMQLNSGTPFYKRHLEEYLGSCYSNEAYEMLLEEVDMDVERRMKELSY